MTLRSERAFCGRMPRSSASFVGGDPVRVEREVGKELDVVRPPVRRCCRVAHRPDRDRPEQRELRRDRDRGLPAGEVLVQVGVGGSTAGAASGVALGASTSTSSTVVAARSA